MSLNSSNTILLSRTTLADECACCGEAIESKLLACMSCEATYHRACRLEAGRCVTEGCKRSKGLEPSKLAEKNQSALQMNVFPFVFGIVVGLAAGLLGLLCGLTLMWTACLAIVIGPVAGRLAHQFWA